MFARWTSQLMAAEHMLPKTARYASFFERQGTQSMPKL